MNPLVTPVRNAPAQVTPVVVEPIKTAIIAPAEKIRVRMVLIVNLCIAQAMEFSKLEILVRRLIYEIEQSTITIKISSF